MMARNGRKRRGRRRRAILARHQLQQRQQRQQEAYWNGMMLTVLYCIVIFQFVASFILFIFPITNPLFPHIPDPFDIPNPPPLNIQTMSDNPPDPLDSSRIAICLFGEARHFDLTAASILKNLLQEHPNADLFAVSPLDAHSYKLLLLKDVPHIASIDIREQFAPPPHHILQQHDCLDLVFEREWHDGFEYDWIVMTRADGYWSGLLVSDVFVPDKYVVPNDFPPVGELSDKFAVANRNLMVKVISESSDSEAWLYSQKPVPICMVSDKEGVDSSMGRSGNNGEECRPCRSLRCVGIWERGWEAVFDRVAGAEAGG